MIYDYVLGGEIIHNIYNSHVYDDIGLARLRLSYKGADSLTTSVCVKILACLNAKILVTKY